MNIFKNEIYIGECVDLTHDGLGVVKIDNFLIFVGGLLPTEQAAIKIIKLGKSYGVGRIQELKVTSKDRVEVIDVKGTWIGTMPLQHMTYAAQLQFKTNQVKQVIRKIAKLSDDLVRETIGAQNIVGYRNKAQVPVRLYNGKLSTGFFRQNSHDFIEIDDFVIQDKRIDAIVLWLRSTLSDFGVVPYDEVSGAGYLRHIMVRVGKSTGDIQVVFITNHKKRIDSRIIENLITQFPNVVSVVQNVNSKQTNVIMGDEQFVLYGKDLIFDELLGVKFGISAKSFYQVNPEQTEMLYQEAIKAAGVSKNDVVIDAYCGIGTIGLCLANQVKQVYGVEIVSDAIERARENAVLNRMTNVTYVVGKAEHIMPKWVDEGIKPNVIIVDPPRKGLDKIFIDSAMQVKPERIVYVSCNPATMARDLLQFVAGGYKVEYVQPVDMFPMTVHVETIVLMIRGNVDI